jgi:hypothetical protein
MTELYINGYAAVLPANTEFSVVEDNPFLTKAGEYTLDMELDLREPVNAKIFKHINRFHRKGNHDTMSAILIADNRIYLRGSAIILGHTDKSVKIQLLSGNSQLNYFIGADKKIDDLDLGKETAITESRAIDSLSAIYPDSNYVCPPVISETGSVFNRYSYFSRPGYQGEYIYDIIMMPYLLFYVKKIPEALGYAVIENQLIEDELLCRLYIPHLKNTLQYNKILSGWTIQDFLIEIEKFCNVVFVIDKEKAAVRIIRFYNWNKNSAKAYIDQVIDEYEEELDGENEIDTINYQAVAYDLPDNDYYKYKHLSEFVLENTIIEEYDTFQDLTAALNPLSDYYKKKKIYHVKKHVLFNGFLEIEADNYYAVQKTDENNYALVRVNELRNAGNKEGNTVELKIIPAQISSYTYDDYASSVTLQAPIVPEEIETEEEEAGVIDLIEAGDNTNQESLGTLPVAIYRRKLNANGPWSQTDIFNAISYSEYIYYTISWNFVPWNSLEPDERDEMVNDFLESELFTLRLTGNYGLFKNNYALNKNIASKKTRKISFIPKGKVSAQNIFVIRNKEFICLSLETKFNNNGALPIVEGKFYPME